MKYKLIKIIIITAIMSAIFQGCRKKNQPPYCPYTPIGPTSGLVDSIYQFMTLAIDPDGDSVAIMFDWGVENTTSIDLISYWVASGETISLPYFWIEPGYYQIKAQAIDKTEWLKSDWSLPFPIKISAKLDAIFKWRYRTGNNVISSPAIGSDGTIYVGSLDGSLYALKQNGKLKWQYQTNSCVGSPPTIGPDGTIYFGSYDGYFYAVNPDGTLKWYYDTGGLIKSSSSISIDNSIYFTSIRDIGGAQIVTFLHLIQMVH